MRKGIIFAILVVAAALFGSSTALAADYTLIIADNDTSSEQQTVVFKESNIAPGFVKDYDIRVENRTSTKARIRLKMIEKVTPSNANLADAMELAVTYNGAQLAGGKYYNNEFVDREILCVAAESNDNLLFNIKIPESAGNEYQSDGFELKFMFQIDNQSCQNESKPIKPPNAGLALPNTGQGQTTFYVLCAIVVFSFAMMLILAILVLIARRRRNNDKEETSHNRAAGSETAKFQSTRRKSSTRRSSR